MSCTRKTRNKCRKHSPLTGKLRDYTLFIYRNIKKRLAQKGMHKKSPQEQALRDATLDYQDSNLDKQNQNLLCYHYTIVQTSCVFLGKRCKDKSFSGYVPNKSSFFSDPPHDPETSACPQPNKRLFCAKQADIKFQTSSYSKSVRKTGKSFIRHNHSSICKSYY